MVECVKFRINISKCLFFGGIGMGKVLDFKKFILFLTVTDRLRIQ